MVYALSFNSGSKGGLYRYDGAVWKKLLNKPQARGVAVDPANPRRIAVCTRGWTAFDITAADGVWISEDAGATWKQCNDGLRMLSGPAIAFNPDKSSQLILATDGAGFYATDVGDQRSHGGRPHDILQSINASDYDDGLQGFDAAAGKRPTALRNLSAGQWVKYSVAVPNTGYYDITCHASATADARFHLEFNGVNVTGPIEVKAGKEAEEWKVVRMRKVYLISGEQHTKLVIEAGSMNIKAIGASQN